jgi:hypothetical protein
MKLEFSLVKEFGKERYYPLNEASKALAIVMGRRSLTKCQLTVLANAGFRIESDVSLLCSDEQISTSLKLMT